MKDRHKANRNETKGERTRQNEKHKKTIHNNTKLEKGRGGTQKRVTKKKTADTTRENESKSERRKPAEKGWDKTNMNETKRERM